LAKHGDVVGVLSEGIALLYVRAYDN